MSPADDDFIRVEDFNSIRLHLQFKNITTKTELRDGVRFYAGEKQEAGDSQEIALVEFLDGGLVVEVPPRSGAEGHQISITVLTEGVDPEIKFVGSGAVEDIAPVESGRERFAILFTEKDDGAWNAILSIYARRQQEIMDFLAAVKG
jgi:hypothetical protein